MGMIQLAIYFLGLLLALELLVFVSKYLVNVGQRFIRSLSDPTKLAPYRFNKWGYNLSPLIKGLITGVTGVIHSLKLTFRP